jgi:hypothetical protein
MSRNSIKFLGIGLLALLIAWLLWLNLHSQNANVQNDAGSSAPKIESLDDPSDCPPMVVAAEGGGPEKIKFPQSGIPNTWMISFSAQFDFQQAEEFNKKTFLGLFYDSTSHNYHTKKIESNIVSSGLIDSEDEQYVYHWHVTLKPKESILFAFDNPMMKKVIEPHPSFIATPCEMPPGKSLHFQTKNYNFLIRATDQVSEITGAQHHSDYTLVLRSQHKSGGKVQESLLSYIPWFDDAMVTVLYVGDLDADGLPDIIIDNPYKYTETNSCGVLFLSSKAKTKGQVVPVSLETQGNKIENTEGQFIFYGC